MDIKDLLALGAINENTALKRGLIGAAIGTLTGAGLGALAGHYADHEVHGVGDKLAHGYEDERKHDWDEKAEALRYTLRGHKPSEDWIDDKTKEHYDHIRSNADTIRNHFDPHHANAHKLGAIGAAGGAATGAAVGASNGHKSVHKK